MLLDFFIIYKGTIFSFANPMVLIFFAIFNYFVGWTLFPLVFDLILGLIRLVKDGIKVINLCSIHVFSSILCGSTLNWYFTIQFYFAGRFIFPLLTLSQACQLYNIKQLSKLNWPLEYNILFLVSQIWFNRAFWI